MESQRILVAVALSLAVMLVWNYFLAPPPAPQQPVAQQAPQAPQGQQGPAQPDPLFDQPATPGATFTDAAPAGTPVEGGRAVSITTPMYTARLNLKGGVLESLKLADYKQSVEAGAPNVELLSASTARLAPLGLIVDGQPSWSAATWSSDAADMELEAGQEASLTLTGTLPGSAGDTTVVRTLTFSGDSYLIEESVVLGGGRLPSRVAFTMASAALAGEDNPYNHTKVAYYEPEAGLEDNDDLDDLRQGLAYSGPVNWGGVEDNYFILALAPDFSPATFKARFVNDLYRVALERTDILPDSGGGAVLRMDYYVGPKVEEQLTAAGHGLVEAIDYGFFAAIAKPLMMGINWFYSFTGNYGVAIILLTIIIKIIFIPLSYKSYKSMNEMKKIQPMMAKIKEKYGDDRQKMNQEMMQLYKTYKINPVGGCVPMLVQIPVFLGLYNALLASIELRHAPFLSTVPFTDLPWLADLSAQDPYYVTPIIMGGTMFLQQRLTPMAGDPMQQKIMMFMPLMFTFFFLNFPAGLVLYWLVNNVLSIAQQWWMLRKS